MRESPTCIKLFKNFKETRTFKPPFAADVLLGGALMCIRAGEVCFFFDWAECRLIRRIDVQPKEVAATPCHAHASRVSHAPIVLRRLVARFFLCSIPRAHPLRSCTLVRSPRADQVVGERRPRGSGLRGANAFDVHLALQS